MRLSRPRPHPESSNPESNLRAVIARGAPLRRCLLAVALLGPAAIGLANPAKKAPGGVAIGAQGAISGALGRDDRSYHAARRPGGFQAANEKQALEIDFSRRGVMVGIGLDRVAFELRAVGYGGALRPVETAVPAATNNRVMYRRGTMTEWYVNGPLGLEQGFTLKSPPVRRQAGPLTLAITVSGDLTPSLEAEGRGLTLARRGKPALTYGCLTATDSTGRELSARLELSQTTLLLRIDDAGARYPVVIDPFIKKATLIPSDGKPEDFFGISVAISSDTIAVGAPNLPHLDDFLPGAAYVFVKPVSGWSGIMTETAKLTGSDTDSGSVFGISVGINGDTAIVGANQAVYVFEKPAGGWAGTLSENAKLVVSDGLDHPAFGEVIGLSGDTVVAGVHSEVVGGNDFQGSAFVFARPAGGWAGTTTESAKLTASDGAAHDEFGVSVGVSGDTVVAGAPNHAGFKVIIGPNGTQIVPILFQGAAYVFVKPAGGWAGELSQTAKLISSDATEGGILGAGVAVSGDTVFAGAPGFSFGDLGAAYVFVKPVGGWVGPLLESATLIPSDAAFDDGLGRSVAVSGDTALVSVPGKGMAYYFVKPAGGWSGSVNQTEKLAFCCTFALSGKTIVGGEDFSEQAFVWGAPPSDQTSMIPNEPNAGNGWYNSAVHVAVTSTDEGGPGVSETRCTLDAPIPPRSFADLPAECRFTGRGADVTTDGRHTLYAASKDVEGIEATPIGTRFQIDQTPPEVACGLTPAFLVKGSGGIVSAAVRDATSGPAASVAVAVTGADVATAGLKSKLLVGFDNAGNSTSASCDYLVQYNFLGFLRPVRERFRPGAIIPVRFKLGDASGAAIPDSQARALASACDVRISFAGGNPSPNCAHYDGRAFFFDLKTGKGLAPGIYPITVKVFAGGNEVNSETVEVAIR